MQDQPIYLFIDSDLNQIQFDSLNAFHHQHLCSLNNKSPLKFIIETHSLAYISPSSLYQTSFVIFNRSLSSSKESLFKKEINKLSLSAEERLIVYDL